MMAEWIEPIFDRTQKDIIAAREQLRLWLSGNAVPTSDLKGCFNASDMNRIEGDISYLAAELTARGYPVSVTSKTWEASGLPTASDISRILANINSLISAYYKPTGLPGLPSNLAAYSDVNAAEENLAGIKKYLDGTVAAYQKCGTFRASARRLLPIKRG